MKNDYYVYLHRSNETGEIFYVGKGRALRYKAKTNRSSEWHKIAEKGFTVEFYATNLTNNESYEIELTLIYSLNNLVNKNKNTKTKDITSEDLALVYYDETSPSCLRYARKVIGSNGRVYKNSGDVAGIKKETSSGKAERYVVRSQGVAIYAHRLVYALHYPLSSDYVIDHIDGNALNNKISNLRQVSQEMNSRNHTRSALNTSGMSGVSRIKRKHLNFIQYVANCKDFNGTLIMKEFSCFDRSEEEAFRLACEWRQQKIKELNEQGAGYTDRHGT